MQCVLFPLKQLIHVGVRNRSVMACERLTKSSAKALVDCVDNILFDCDGVLWDGRGVIPGSLEAVTKLRNMGKKIYYITNNSSKTREQYLKKCREFGYPATEDEIVCTAYVAALYLRNLDFMDKVYVVGNPAMGKELDLQGIRHTGIGPLPFHGDVADFIEMKPDPEIKCVLVGFDGHLSYLKILQAATYLQNPNCLFLATNEDSHLPVSNSPVRIPGTGTMVSAVKTPAQREPVIIGKPERPMFEELQKAHNLDPTRSLMVGDRIMSDIGLAKSCGMRSLLVLSGVTSESQLMASCQHTNPSPGAGSPAPVVPDFYTECLADLDGFIDPRLCQA